MNDELRGKRLLLLGSSVWKNELRRFADEHGITLAVVGNKPAPLDEVADELYRVDSTDHEAMKQFIKTHDFDGIFMGGSELIISHACEYINELGYPCYCTKEQWDSLADKSRFKALCQQFGLPVARLYTLDDPITFPVVTKPVDGCGGTGISICHDDKELQEGYSRAKAASRSGKAIIEQFVDNDSIKVFYTFSQGVPHYTTMATKYPVRHDNPESYVSTLYLYESSYATDFRQRFEERLFQMFAHLGIREGSLWIEVFKNGDEYCFNEAAFRYMGQVSLYPVDYLTGINQLAADITYALTGKSQLMGHRSLIGDDVPRKKHYCMYCPQLADGRIESIEGIENLQLSTLNSQLSTLKPQISTLKPQLSTLNSQLSNLKLPECVYAYIMKSEGDEISGPHTLFHVLGCIHLVFDTIDELRQLINKVHQLIHVTDDQGHEMLMDMIDWEGRQIIV
ncbi:MAG: ATP-grasp domain-containing protein [Prevotella sp.]|nr:ATP-grasp domain-containing protein [Prevotella sp.]